ncbi:hypothetical protein V1T76_19420 [Roseibium sp. FZY0029]|uniref:hypothetical protein n=1 Tax=Roseibium sp. FZY0029 TaxID=3116647 RepID=UPI002E992A96|nr:hypothetical protein [Roseibium sp. FZY0029]
MAMLSIKTDDGLLQKLSESAQKKLTKEQIKKQRVSIVFAGMPKNSGMTKVEIEKVLAESE